MAGVEPATSSLPRMRSTPELHWRYIMSFLRAEDGAQTRDPQLGRLVLYRLSYFRKRLLKWVLMDSNHRSRKTADLQSAPFGHSGKHPNRLLFRANADWLSHPPAFAVRIGFHRSFFSAFLSLLSDSNQRPRDYKSRALAN